MSILGQIFRLLDPKERRTAFKVGAVVAAVGISESLAIASILPFLTLLNNPTAVSENDFLREVFDWSKSLGIETTRDFLILLGIGSFMVTVLTALLRTAVLVATTYFIELRRHSISRRIFEIYLLQPFSFFLTNNSADLSKMTLSEVDRVVAQIFRPIINMLASILVVIAICTMLVLVDPMLALVAAAFLSALYLIVFVSLRSVLSSLGKNTVEANRSRFFVANEAFSGIKYIKIKHQEFAYENMFTNASQQFSSSVAKNHVLNQAPKYLVEVIAFGGLLLVAIGSVVSSSSPGEISNSTVLPILGLYAFSAYRLQPAMQAIFQGVSSLRYGEAALGGIISALELKSDVHAGPSQSTIASEANPKLGDIELRELSFTYPGSDEPVFNNLNFKISAGSSIGLIGATGSGKSTLIDVILGLLEPTRGALVVGGAQISATNIRLWQSKVGYVPQDVSLLDITIAKNIAFGDPDGKVDQQRVEKVAKLAKIHDFIIGQLSDGYDTEVGERGVRLSGGQRQRIGIARALYSDPELLVFDEATSALDSETEAEIVQSIAQISKTRTTITIAHRKNTLQHCDVIIELKGGEIVNAKAST